MTKEEALRALAEMEEKVEQIELILKKRVSKLHKAHCTRLLRKKEMVMERLRLLEEGADYLLSTPSSYKMVQSLKVSYETF
ncbi:hypothetical protein [Bacillus xiapuensis]|uniref:hypothetical protein n=1 Tax=Bacillus xiapuensis TaxID=2014075 RepID=UPI000C239AE7|nr:hypothetical protein [Bacillus xiapuensis]